MLAALAIVAAALTIGIVSTSSANAASPGSGFGEWAPSTRYGWHGSMAIGGIHTYCIFPGLSLPTGESEDRGISGNAAGLDPQRLTAINMLVSTYGQTSDPVQAAGVAWAVKAIANWNEALHTFGYPGDSLPGAIDWVLSHVAPEHSAAIQNLAVGYYNEAMALPAGRTAASGSLQFTTQADDPLRGTVTTLADLPEARGTLTLENAVFADTGTASRDDAVVGRTYDIVATVPNGQTSFTVRGSGRFHGGFLPVVHHFTTPGGQDTAGPGGELEFPVAGEDAVAREATFAPVITTQVASRYVGGGGYVDDVTFASARGTWARAADGGYLPVAATATVYRTDAEPVEAPAVPEGAEPVGTLTLTSEPALGPTVPYRVESDWPLPGPGFYTAVWAIDAAAQPAATAAALESGYRWIEAFGERSQVTMVGAISSRADPLVAVGATMSDEVIVDGVVPTGGLDLSASVYRVPDGTAAADACTPENLLSSTAATPVRITAPGSVRIPGPTVPDFDTYVWRERAVDVHGALVHEGACGVESETTRAPMPTVTTTATERAGFGAVVTDTAHVSDPVPVSGITTLTFEVYRAPHGVAPDAACTPETLVDETAATPVTVTAAGSYTSPGVRLSPDGVYYWIESLWHTPDGGAARLLSRGACGVANETTVIDRPAVTTLATERAGLGEPFRDTATVSGLGAGVDAQLVFSVYHNAAGQEPTCTPETLEAQTDAVAVTGSGEYTSPDLTSERIGVKQWIAELRYRPEPGAEPITLHRGACGEAGEQTLVDVLASSGVSAGGGIPLRTIGGIGAAILAAGCALTSIVAFRRARFGTAPRAR